MYMSCEGRHQVRGRQVVAGVKGPGVGQGTISLTVSWLSSPSQLMTSTGGREDEVSDLPSPLLHPLPQSLGMECSHTGLQGLQRGYRGLQDDTDQPE